MAIDKPYILYENLFEDYTPTVGGGESVATGYSILNVDDWRPYTYVLYDGTATAYVYVDCTTATSADTLGIFGHNFSTSQPTVSVESSANDADWTERQAGFTNNSNDYAILKTFTTASARYWRVKLTGQGAAPKMAIVCLGAKLDMEKQVQKTFTPNPEKLHVETARSKDGYLMGATVRNISLEINAFFTNCSDTWIRNTFATAWTDHLSLCKPFFWSWNPTTYATEIYLVNIPPDFVKRAPYNFNRRDLTLMMQGIKET